MNAITLDLTIDRLLADPVIGAAMRADNVDPRRLGDLLRSAARSIARGSAALRPAVPAGAARDTIAGSCSR